MNPQRPRLAFVINHVAFFVSHRLSVAIAAREAGYDVLLVTGQSGSLTMEQAAVQELGAAGIPHIRTRFTASGMNPVKEALGALQVLSTLARHRPSVVHCASPKGVLIGGIAARLLRTPRVVLAISGMGFAFTQEGKRTLLRRIASGVLATLGVSALRNPRARVVVQNSDDRTAVEGMLGFGAESRVVLIPGSGVDLEASRAIPMSEKEFLVVLPARVVRDKGVEEFVAAARLLRSLHPGWRFVVAGGLDYEHPTAFSVSEIDELAQGGAVEFLGFVDDIGSWFARASIVCLPSYREGMPKSLLEAASWGCAVVTTDVPGCREAVLADESGLLVPPRDSEALAHALASLIVDPLRRAAFGRAGRDLAERRFGLDVVIKQLLSLYK